MKLQFDPDQPFQREAVAAVTDLFEGQPFPDAAQTAWGVFPQHASRLVGLGNPPIRDEERLRRNLRAIQERNDVDVPDPHAPVEAWELHDGPDGTTRRCPHFSVEMETGTGKTYVYLRTIFELHRRHGLRKFVIVVPSVAIREGVLKSIEVTADHFRALYGNVPFEHFTYDARRLTRLRHFAYADTLQVMVINIDAFRKNFAGTEAEQKGNVIYKESDRLSGRPPIDFVQAARPVVVIDEPQSVDSTPKAQEAIRALNPLCTLRYSATHRDAYNLVYRLDPVRAFELRLVKQIVVASARAEGVTGEPFVRVEKVEYRDGIRAKLRILVQGPEGAKERSVTVKGPVGLHALSKGRREYENVHVTAIHAEPGQERVEIDGRALRVGEETGGFRDDVWRAQVRHTLRRHLDKELEVRGRGIKVLSLFFLDRVANYRDVDAQGRPAKGKIAQAFEEELAQLARRPEYRDLAWLKLPFERLHNGYFAQDRKGALRDTRGDTQADDEVYDLIMRDKERLLSLDEPLRFIFSHSALREGWDNPNVFQICTLHESGSVLRKRQEIGRGLRLPVDQDGVRVRDDAVNRLYVMASESYEDFARALQAEYEEEGVIAFGRVPLSALARLRRAEDEAPVGRAAAEELRDALVAQGFLDPGGRILPAFDPARPAFLLALPPPHEDLADALVDLLCAYRIERHVRRERDLGVMRLRRDVLASDDFRTLWDAIRPRTTYRVDFDSSSLAQRCVEALRRMPRIEKPVVTVSAGRVDVRRGGVQASALSVAQERIETDDPPVPDPLAYLQERTDLTRPTLARVLRESGRLDELLLDPPRFLDAAASVLRHELRRLLVDGVHYERRPGPPEGASWDAARFAQEIPVDLARAVPVAKSVYDHVACESEVERAFARGLDAREDVRLFLKLPRWFEIETPVGRYNPDWAILKEDGTILACETKGTVDLLRLRASEADKARCGAKHFAALGVPFVLARRADEV